MARYIHACLAAPLLVALTAASCHSDRAEPTPAQIPYVDVNLPPGARDYHAYETGLQHTMLQVRFELPSSELPQLAARLPCRLGPIKGGPPEHGLVGTNDRAWYEPEDVKKHRSCEYSKDLTTASFLVDVERSDRAIVHAVISRE